MVLAAMIVGSVTILGVVAILAFLLVHEVKEHRSYVEREQARSAALFESAMRHLNAKDVREKVDADALATQYEIQLQQIRDAYAAHVDEEEKEQEVPRIMYHPDGREINLNDGAWEVFGS